MKTCRTCRKQGAEFYDQSHKDCIECTKKKRRDEYHSRIKSTPMTAAEIERAARINREGLRIGLLAAFANCHADGIRC